jgi:ABC-type phosphate/phosphonate transport system ATPase subunit
MRTGTKEDVRTLNAYLDSLQAQAQELFQQMKLADDALTAENIKNRFTGKGEKTHTLLSVFADHNERMKSLVGQEFEKSTCSVMRPASCMSKSFYPHSTIFPTCR